MGKITTVEYVEENGYGGGDGFVINATTVNGRVQEVIITLLRPNLSTKAMRLLGVHLERLANNIDDDNPPINRAEDNQEKGSGK